MKVAALVILFNPVLDEVTNNVQFLSKQVDIVFLVDNSPIRTFFYESENVLYHGFDENKGIAFALNFGCKWGMSLGFDWIFTFDQDTEITEDVLVKMKCALTSDSIQRIGIIAPSLLVSERTCEFSGITEVEMVMTSGALTNLKAYYMINGFDNDLFIDWVDWDFCVRLRQNGFKIIKDHSCVIKHHLGDTKEIVLFGSHIAYATNHSPLRLYYKSRNAVYLTKKFKNSEVSTTSLLKATLMDFLKVIMFEHGKVPKSWAIICGIVDALRGKLGARTK